MQLHNKIRDIKNTTNYKLFFNYDLIVFIEIEIDDYYYYFDEFFTIFQSCLEKDLFLPRFCYHVKLKIAGNCRMCIVEELESSKLVISCATAITQGMILYTQTESVREGREYIIEFLLINHPLDCPICDQGGECDLQDQTMAFGLDRGRFHENFKRNIESKNYTPFIKFLLNRCIQCTRCTRFISDSVNDYSLSLLGRGLNSEISNYTNEFIRSEISGNVIDLCPVGALTAKNYSFSLRYWEVFDLKMVDFFDSLNSLIRIDFRGLSIMRILPVPSVYLDEEWITDKIRFSFDSFLYQRLMLPMLLSNNTYITISWTNILYFIKNYFINFLNFFIFVKKKNICSQFYLGNFIDFFSFKSFKEYSILFAFNYFKNTNLIFNKLNDFRKNYFIELNNLEFITIFFFFNLNLRLELPMLNLKIKNYVKENELCLVFTFGFLTNLNYYYQHLGNNWLSVLNFLEKNFLCFENKIGLFFGIMLCKLNLYMNVFLAFTISILRNLKNNFFLFNLMALDNKNLFINEENLQFIKLKNNFIKFFNYFRFSHNLEYDNFINSVNYSMKKQLFIYQGHHADYSIIFSNIILPTKFFFEKSTCYINIIGLISNLAFNSFKYKLMSLKSDYKIFNLFLEYFGLKKKYNIFLDIKTFLTFKKEHFSFFFFYNYDYYYFTNILNFFFKNAFSFINNYYLSDSLTRNSLTMRLGSRLLTLVNDFKYLTCFYINYNDCWYY